jgi:ABC-type phosphate transport system substrate-binding protein
MSSYSKLSALSAFALLGAGVATAGALDIKGSDTLEIMSKEVLAACPGTSSLVYVGGGSSSGEQALRVGAQQVAPMSRFLAASRTCAGPGAGVEAEGLAHSLDGIAIVQSRREGAPNQCDTNADGVCAEACPAGVDPAKYACKDRQNRDQQCIGLAFSDPAVNSTRFVNVKEKNSSAGLQCHGCENLDSDAALEYELETWADSIALLFGGLHHDGTVDCNSDVRRTLADEWASLTRKSCADQRCAQIKHIFRRSDLSGTTDTFKSLIGINSFCNGSDFQDNDPIRRPCEDGEQVCQADGTLGLVVNVFVPEGLSGGTIYRRTACQPGNFAPAPAPGGVGTVQAPRDSLNRFGCLNDASNRIGAEDGRSHNLVLRNANGSIVLDANGRELVGSFYRIHSGDTSSTIAKAGDAEACRRESSTIQIGCLVQASPCSIGFAGVEAIGVSGTTNLKVKNVRPTAENIRRLITAPTSTQLYPLARKLFLNTMIGAENVTGEEATFAACWLNRAVVDAAANAAGYITLDETGALPVECVDFDETACGAATNHDACAP